LCRIYDTHDRSLNLPNFLDTIKSNLEIFDTNNFRERLKDNPFVDSLTQTARKPDINILEDDIKAVNSNNELVTKLLIWRHNIIAHKNAKNAISKVNIPSKYPIMKKEVDELLTRATTILNRYSGLFNATTYSTNMVGSDDYLYILETITDKIARDKEILDSEIAKYRTNKNY
jgi:hypothetical protein